jgi:HAD superfamily hydrolase (TIGR01459 family)
MADTDGPIGSLDALVPAYDALLCDVWGVVHNGVRAYPQACAALRRAREQGRAVVLVTNAPRPQREVETQLAALGVPREAYDRVVTSGDVSRALIENGARTVFHIGPERDLALYDGLDVELVEEGEARTVVCTGLFDDETETPADYEPLLRRLRTRNLPFICANPDVVVERGDRLIWCAGALARDYAQLGGQTLIAGKPHRPIYDAAVAAASEVLGRPVTPDRVLAIGDGMLTDIKGAADYGLDALFITAGIHAREYGETGAPDPQRLRAFLARHGYKPVATMTRLQ